MPLYISYAYDLKINCLGQQLQIDCKHAAIIHCTLRLFLKVKKLHHICISNSLSQRDLSKAVLSEEKKIISEDNIDFTIAPLLLQDCNDICPSKFVSNKKQM